MCRLKISTVGHKAIPLKTTAPESIDLSVTENYEYIWTSHDSNAKNAIKRLRSNKGDKWRQRRRSGELAIKLIDPALLFFLPQKKRLKSADARRIGRRKYSCPAEGKRSCCAN